MAITLEHAEAARDLWILEFERDALTRFTFDPAHDLAGVWSPDGKTIAFSSTRSGQMDLFTKPADGTRPAVPILETDVVEALASWTPDGSGLVYESSSDDQTTWDIGLLDLTDGGEAHPLIQSPFSERQPSVSPDGRWLVYVSDESGQDEVFVRPFPSAEGRWPVSSDGGTEPRWSTTGRELFYRGQGAMMSVPISKGASFVAGTPSPLFDDIYRRDHSSDLPNYDISSDGRFLMLQEIGGTNSFHVVLHWDEEVKRLVPTE